MDESKALGGPPGDGHSGVGDETDERARAEGPAGPRYPTVLQFNMKSTNNTSHGGLQLNAPIVHVQHLEKPTVHIHKTYFQLAPGHVWHVELGPGFTARATPQEPAARPVPCPDGGSCKVRDEQGTGTLHYVCPPSLQTASPVSVATI